MKTRKKYTHIHKTKQIKTKQNQTKYKKCCMELIQVLNVLE